ncbi:hypothetical protein HPB52_004315 [Rhipicephalus sanguineus]|uniref:DUF7041 domain-containing protein n=1 Tax=Rhipicephalus sanguineus TaxID=34632 RepID=A0A9D4SXN4_RHISA|nr:hypothetical protein HPB52_004315 [Rhipicephalus sanguineus]
MLPRLCPPVPPFHPAYPRAWFMQLDACLAVNGVTAQPLMHNILLDALPDELRHLSAASSSSPQPYDDLCAAVLARYGATYRPLPGTREFRVSPPSTRAVPPGPQPSHDRDLPSPATTPPTSRQATSASIPAPDHPPDEVQEVPAAIGHSTESSVFSTASAHGPSDVPAICTPSPTSMAHDTSATSGSTTATSPHALEPAIDTDILTSAVRPPIAEASPAMSNEPAFSTSTLCASCQQELPSSSKSPTADVQAHNQLRPHLRDAGTMTEAPEDDMRAGSPMAEQAAHVTPATSTGFQHPDQRTSPPVPPAEGASTRTGASSEPAATTPARCHRRFAPEPLTQDAAHLTCGHCAGALCRHPRQRCARTGKTHRSSYSPMVARRGFTAPFRTVSRTSPAPALVPRPQLHLPAALTCANRSATERPLHVVVGYAWARHQRTFA